MGMMRSRHAGLLLVGCLGVVLGWFAHSALQRPESPLSVARNPDPAAPAPTEPAGSGPAERARATSTTSTVPRTPSEAQMTRLDDFPDPSQGRDLELLPHTSSDSPVNLPADASQSNLPPDLADPVSIWCKFDPGHGAHQRDGKVSMYELAYQGGPVTYDTIDISSGTGRMTGSAGATGSNEGALDVLVTATPAGLHFSAVNPRGELVITTVFGAVDKQGRHAAVMTTHGTRAFDGSFQTYGSCDAGSVNAPRPSG